MQGLAVGCYEVLNDSLFQAHTPYTPLSFSIYRYVYTLYRDIMQDVLTIIAPSSVLTSSRPAGDSPKDQKLIRRIRLSSDLHVAWSAEVEYFSTASVICSPPNSVVGLYESVPSTSATTILGRMFRNLNTITYAGRQTRQLFRLPLLAVQPPIDFLNPPALIKVFRAFAGRDRHCAASRTTIDFISPNLA